MDRPRLTLIIPVFNEEAVIPELHQRLHSASRSWPEVGDNWEVLFINNDSQDSTLKQLRRLAGEEPRYKIISFSRNFGHQMSITAGLDRADGEAIVIMDADLQDPPEVIGEMLVRWRQGFDVVYGVRKKRFGETIFKRATAAIFYRVLRAMLGGVSIPTDAGDFRLMGRPVVLAMRALRERHRFVRGMVAWVGFKQTAVYYDRPGRFAGETKYPLSEMVRFALDGITSFSVVPLRFATWLGVFSGFVAVATAAWALFQRFHGTGMVAGWTTIMIVVAMGSSAQLLMTGVLGEYVGRIYEEIKRRPLYIVAEEINIRRDEAPPNSSSDVR
ncbi:MAG TPA: glycosyltransferase family 2 protein [Polyangiaceae bacterium]|jgi:dolichol-phosphate mannosyltransferase